MDEKRRDDIVIGIDGQKDLSASSAIDDLTKPATTMSSPNSVQNNSLLAVLAYCGSSILMTTTNKYVLGGDFNLSFFLLCVQVHLSEERRCGC